MRASDDRIKQELEDLKHTINLSSPIFQGHTNDCFRKSHSVTMRENQVKEDQHCKNFNSRSGISTPITKDAEVSTYVAEFCRRVHYFIHDRLLKQVNQRGSMDGSVSANSEEELRDNVLKEPKKRIPRAKQMHMDGILHGLPGMKSPAVSASREAHVYCDEMKKINKEKDMTHFRTRDQYSDYVEARARFSKMHSVN